MATLYKKLAKKIKPKTKKTAEKPPEKVGKDYWLLGILLLTIFFLVGTWPQLDNTNRALYVALIVSLGSTYARRQFNLKENQENLVSIIGVVALIAAVALFIVKIYYNFIA